jgi:hypothetical protein
MIRSEPNSGEVFDARTVKQKVDLTSDTKIAIPVILDLLEQKIIWADLALARNPYWHNNLEGNYKGMTIIGMGVTSVQLPTLYDLFSLHIEARGQRVTNIKDAKHIFSLTDGITPYDGSKITSNFL